MPAETFTPFSYLISSLTDIEGLPLDSVMGEFQDAAFLDRFGITDFSGQETATERSQTLTLAFSEEFSFEIPSVSGLEIVLGGSGGVTELPFTVTVDKTTSQFRSAGITGIVTVRFPRAWLKPMRKNTTTNEWEEDPSAAHRQVVLTGTISIDQAGQVSFSGSNSFSLPPAMIGDTGVIIEMNDLRIVFNDADVPAGAPAYFRRGVYIQTAAISMRDPSFPIQSVSVTDCYIGSGGFSAEIDVNTNLTGELGGFEFSLTQFGLDITQNSVTGCDIQGSLRVPWFDDQVSVKLDIASNGDFSIGLGVSSGVEVLSISGLLDLKLSAVEFGVKNNVPELALSGELEFGTVGGLDLPDFVLKRLTINAKGEVTIDGGWIDLGDALAFDFNGFQMELTRIGFGTEGSENWIGLSGSIQLSDGLAVGGNVDGLRILWDPSNLASLRVTVEGVGVNLTIPDTLTFEGYVRFINDPATSTVGFSGDITLSLPTLNFTGAASLLIGRRGNDPFFYIAVTADLPVGLPLAQTGIAFYGFQGLLGFNVYPDKNPDEHWFEDWYLGSATWASRSGKPGSIGVTQSSKWRPQVPAFAIGLGATLGTFPDNGFSVNGRVLLVLILPGLLMLEGRANILAPRSDLSSNDPSKPIFRALVILDANEGTFLMNVGAQFDKSPLIKVGGTMEAFFDFNDLMAWHLYLGIDDPKTKRIQATILGFLQANAYWMLTARDLRFGAWVGYDERWTFGPLEVRLAAWMEGGATVGFAPVQIAGFLELYGEVSLKAFGIGVGLSAHARLEAEAPQPFRVKGTFRVKIELPWPFDDIGANVTIEWSGNQTPPDFLPEVFRPLTLEHALTDVTWPPYNTPLGLVPADARPILTFDRPVRDATLPFGGADVYTPESVGKFKFQYDLTEVTLRDNTAGVDVPLRGTWKASATPTGSPSSKLEVFGKNPFAYNSTRTNSYIAGILLHTSYPCGEDVFVGKRTCVELAGVPIGERILDERDWGNVKLVVGTFYGQASYAHALPVADRIFGGILGIANQRLRPCIHVDRALGSRFIFAQAVEDVQVTVLVEGHLRVVGLLGNNFVSTATAGNTNFQLVTLSLNGPIDQIVFQGYDAKIGQICFHPAGTRQRAEDQARYRSSTSQWVESYYQEEDLMRPGHNYTLTARVVATRYPDGATQTYNQSTTFTVAQPPGAPDASLPQWQPAQTGNTPQPNPYRDLAVYVAETIPADGQRPVYTTYDVSVNFNQNYIESLYTGDMRIKIFGPGDAELTPLGGIGLVFGRNRTATLTTTDETWLSVLDGMSCVPVTVDRTRIVTPTTVTTTANLELQPASLHRAVLYGLGREVFSWSFVTSKYESFTDHFNSYRGTQWTEDIGPFDTARLETLLLAAQAGGPSYDPAEVPAFQEIYYDLFRLPSRGFPLSLEWTEIRSPAGAVALYLSSPEPIEWTRIDLAVRLRTVFGLWVDQPVVLVRNEDQTKAFVFFRTTTGLPINVPIGAIEFRFTYRKEGPGLPKLSSGGVSTPETVVHRLDVPLP